MVETSLEYGINTFHSSIGGIGGCPYSSKVVGNLGFGRKGGIQGAQFGFNKYIEIMTPIRFKAFRSYTCMINMDEFNSTWYPSPAIFDFSIKFMFI